ncbi:hypothetical protein C8R43DRAFT_961444 [Mycena crocata]|nr:hypothetical protein C8R43DRAFT_961444 [Mycena crocata]
MWFQEPILVPQWWDMIIRALGCETLPSACRNSRPGRGWSATKPNGLSKCTHVDNARSNRARALTALRKGGLRMLKNRNARPGRGWSAPTPDYVFKISPVRFARSNRARAFRSIAEIFLSLNNEPGKLTALYKPVRKYRKVWPRMVRPHLVIVRQTRRECARSNRAWAVTPRTAFLLRVQDDLRKGSPKVGDKRFMNQMQWDKARVVMGCKTFPSVSWALKMHVRTFLPVPEAELLSSACKSVARRFWFHNVEKYAYEVLSRMDRTQPISA